MSFKKRINPFIPPVMWSAMVKKTRQKSVSAPPSSREVLETATNEEFTVRFQQVAHPSGTFFVPDYAAHRQAAVEQAAPIIMIEDNNRSCEPYLTSLEYEFVFRCPDCSSGPVPKIWPFCGRSHRHNLFD